MNLYYMKKRIAILYSGQTRSNGLNPNYNHDNLVLDSINTFFLHDRFKNKYDYDVFFSVDEIDVRKTQAFFGEHLKNIHITEKDWFMNPIEKTIQSYPFFQEKYINIDFKHCQQHTHALYQYYRLYCVYQLMKHYQKENNTTYDYFIRIRPDLRIMKDLLPLIDCIDSNDKHMIMEHDHLWMVDKELEDVFNLIERYGDYNKEVEVRNPIFKHFLKNVTEMASDQITRFCPERQLLEFINETIKNKNMVFNEAFLGITYPSYYLLYRGNGQYGYAEYNEKNKWIPYQMIEPLPSNNPETFMNETYAQACQDIFVEGIMKGKRDGVFVEIGSNHPEVHNNTFLLEKKYNWKGLMIDYLTSFQSLYETQRPKSHVILEDARTINYRKFLDDHHYPLNIDYLQMDLDVDNKSTLETFLLLNDTVFDKYKFATITFEHDIYTGNYFDTQPISRKILKERGYVLVFPNVSILWGGSYKPFEDWYVHPDLVDMTQVNKVITTDSLTCDQIRTRLKEMIRI
jgi:hypothetical protein